MSATARTMDAAERLGDAIRREVLGEAHVDAANANRTDLTSDLQDLVTRYCWGEIWGRPGLARRDRSILNLGMLIALNRSHELSLHVKGAIRNGLARDEIMEVILQAAIYCGVPAALEAARVASRALDSIDQDR